jgi:adenylate cyclase
MPALLHSGLMSVKKFNPFDLSARDKPQIDKDHIHIPVRPELTKPLNLFLTRCDMFLERAKVLNQAELMLELQKISSTAKYLQSLINTSDVLRLLRLDFELGSPSATPQAAVLGQPLQMPEQQTGSRERGSVLVIDDDKRTRELLKFVLEDLGHKITTAQNGHEGLSLIHTSEIDVVLVDIVMPEMNGYQFLNLLKADMMWRNIPVLVLSGVDETTSAARCIQMGAEDYLTKPIDAVLLQARINACLEKKRLRDLEEAYVNQVQTEQEKSERLLLNILPAPIAARLKQGESVIADHFPEVTVLFADIVGFTKLATEISPAALVERLNEIFSAFDALAEQHGLEKIKTIGDAYMVVGGLPMPLPNHAEAIAAMALDMQQAIVAINSRLGTDLNMRIGVNTGPVVAGIIGTKKFNYDLWGDTVNTASRMEESSHAGHILVSESSFQLLKHKFTFAKRPPIEVKGKGEMTTYLLLGRRT